MKGQIRKERKKNLSDKQKIYICIFTITQENTQTGKRKCLQYDNNSLIYEDDIWSKNVK